MTVYELIKRLTAFPPDAEITSIHNLTSGRITQWTLVNVSWGWEKSGRTGTSDIDEVWLQIHRKAKP